MLRRLLSLILCSAALASEAQDPFGEALQSWVDDYLRGRFDLTSTERVDYREDLLGAGRVGVMTRNREFRLLVDRAARRGDPAYVDALLTLAAAGIESEQFDVEQQPQVVRTVVESALLMHLRKPLGRERVVTLAREGIERRLPSRNAIRGAALVATALLGLADCDSLLAKSLTDPARAVRRSAALGLAHRRQPGLIPALSRALEEETDIPTARLLAGALDATLEVLDEADVEDPDALRSTAANAALVRFASSEDWRLTTALCEVLESARDPRAIPVLLDFLTVDRQLERDLRAGNTSGALQDRAFGAMASLTGALFPRDDLERWRSWWTEVESDFTVPPRRSADSDPRYSDRGFFGIPVTGSRVVFVLDISISMRTPIERDEQGRSVSRMRVAIREVERALSQLPPYATFNLVLFSGEARMWKKDAVAASPAKKRLLMRFLERIEPEAQTNIWDGIRFGLDIDGWSGAGSSEPQVVDEMFLLSDGSPTAGAIQDPDEMVALVTEVNRFAQARIHTVFLGHGGDGDMGDDDRRGARKGEWLMRELALRNGGTFVRR